MPRIAVSLSSAIVAVVGLLLNVVAQETYDEPQVIDEASQSTWAAWDETRKLAKC